MKFIRKTLIFSLVLLMIIVNMSTVRTSAKTNYNEGTLLKTSSSSTVYYVGSDGKKYVFPEGKTYNTWFDDFSQVKEVSTSVLDEYPDGGVMPVKGGTRLITHQNTNKVYAVEAGGVLRWIPNEAKAKELFGDDWAKKIIDVLPGFFSNYQLGDQVSDALPNGYLVTDGSKYYYIENGKKRLMTKEALKLNNLKEANALRIKNMNRYGDDDSISNKKDSIANFVPPIKEIEEKKVVVCHNEHNISISKSALKAHLAIGDTLGRCGGSPSVEPNDTEVVEPGDWCSVLLGLFNSNSLGYSSNDPHDLLDVNNDGVVNLSDNAVVVNLYNSGNNSTCLNYIEDNYTSENYQNLDWCSGLVQGISDNLGDTDPFDPFDLNNDGKINLSDVGMVASYVYDADQVQCYSEYVPALPEMSGGGTTDNDIDNDGYNAISSGGTDCNDNNAQINPGATEICGDSIDQDCSGADLQCVVDNDADNDGYDSTSSGGTDCNDNNASIHPGATEIANDGIDQDCNGSDLVSSNTAERLVFEDFEDSDWTDNFSRAVNEANVSMSSEVSMGNVSARMYGGYLGASFDYIFADHNLPNVQAGDKYYVKYYTYYEDSVDWTNVSDTGWKQFRGMPPDGWPLVTMKFGEGSHADLFTHSYYEGLDDIIPDRLDISRPPHNQWVLHEYYLSYGENAGGYSWYIDGVLVAGIPMDEHTMTNWPRNTGTPVSEVNGFRFAGGNGAVPDSVYYVDNVEIWKGFPDTASH